MQPNENNSDSINNTAFMNEKLMNKVMRNGTKITQVQKNNNSMLSFI